MDNKGTHSRGTPSKTPRDHSNSAHEQRQRLLAWLRQHGQIDTITARRELDILGVAPRIHELRHRYGLPIETVWIESPTDCGKLHRVALYALKPEVSHE